MNILFSVGELEKNLTAPSKIVFKLAVKLTEKGHRCFIVGNCSQDIAKEEIVDGITFLRVMAIPPIARSSTLFEKFIEENKFSRNEGRQKFVLKHPVASLSLFFKYSSRYKKLFVNRRYLKAIKVIIADKNIDALICVCKPVREYRLLLENDIPVSKYAYQMDPWGLHYFENPDMNKSVMVQENKAYEKAASVFTTVPLLEQYKNLSEYKQTAEKSVAVEFPNIEKYEEKSVIKSLVNFDDRYINILFSGVATDDFRSPEKVLQSFSALIQNGEKIKVFFMGDCYSGAVKNYADRYPENIIMLNRTDIDTAFKTMSCADILLNISNTLPNQVPSKIFDYFSLGKPIINVQKIENCPAREYFDKYPLCFTFKDWEPDTEGLENFIKSAKGKKVDFETVKSIYNTCTPEYVAAVIEETLQKEN